MKEFETEGVFYIAATHCLTMKVSLPTLFAAVARLQMQASMLKTEARISEECTMVRPCVRSVNYRLCQCLHKVIQSIPPPVVNSEHLDLE
jgi:hypothetical protein